MKKNFFLSLMVMFPMLASAHDTEIGGIYYNLNSDTKQATVTFKGDNYTESNCYSGDLTIPSEVLFNSETYKVTSIGDNAFSFCSALNSVKIPESVTSIGVYSFSFCRSLLSVNIPEGVIGMGAMAFFGCDKLRSIIIPGSIKDMTGACLGCNGLEFVTISDGVKKIQSTAFLSCKNITSIYVLTKTPPEIDIYSFDKKNYSNASLNVPTGCKDAYRKAEGWKKFKKILEDVNIPDAEIDGIYYNLNSDTKQATVTYKKDDQTKYNWYSGDITIPSTVSHNNIEYKVTSIGENAFQFCMSLTSVTIPESVSSIGKSAFFVCTKLANICIPKSVRSIGSSAFCCNNELESITIPNGVTIIKDGTFVGCNGLKSITISEGLETIESGAFQACKNIKEINVLGTRPPKIGKYSFEDTTCSTATLYVPTGSKDTYSKAKGWKMFKTIKEK